MKINIVTAGALVALGAILGAAAITTAAPELNLRGGRFRPLSYAELNPAQKAYIDRELGSRNRPNLDGPTNIYLRSPETANAGRAFGRYLRFEAPMEQKLKEIAILLTARFWGGHYVWYSHRQWATEAGLSPAIIDAMAVGKRPDPMSGDEAAVYDFSTELLQTRKVSDAVYKNFVDRFGERGVVELVSLMGNYHGTTALMAVDRYPLPNGAKDEIERPM
jgi:4-carboxymuconolactone decarboxylase